MFKKCALVAALALAAVSSSNAVIPQALNGFAVNSRGVVTVGTDEVANIHVDAGVSRTDTITYPGANYISVRFSDFNLPPGDEVIVRSPDSTTVHRYSGKGRNDVGSFIASLVPGGKAIVEYVSKNKEITTLENTVRFGYTIPGFARGFPHLPLTAACGTDQSKPAKCFKEGTPFQDLPQAYNKARAVARLLVNGTGACTGFLAGSEGHLLTSSHCFKDLSMTKVYDVDRDLAALTDVEFDAESTSCEEECRNWFGCKGTVVTGSPIFLAFDGFFDYALLKMPPTVDVSSYGYLQLRGSGPNLGEEIYIPQHPKGNAKRIAYKVDDGKKATVTSISATVPCGEDLIEYKVDTQPGSSGSPVLASKDNLVVALHRCGSCPNYGADAANIIKSLKYKKIVIKDLIVGGPRTPPPAPAPTKPAGFCGKYTESSSCRIWFWCSWDASTDTCLNRW